MWLVIVWWITLMLFITSLAKSQTVIGTAGHGREVIQLTKEDQGKRRYALQWLAMATRNKQDVDTAILDKYGDGHIEYKSCQKLVTHVTLEGDCCAAVIVETEAVVDCNL